MEIHFKARNWSDGHCSEEAGFYPLCPQGLHVLSAFAGLGPHAKGYTTHGGVLQWGCPSSWMVYVMENPMKMDDLGVPPVLGNLHIDLSHFLGLKHKHMHLHALLCGIFYHH